MKNIFNKDQILITFICILVFGFSLSFDFVLYDDQVNILFNQELLNGNFSYFWHTPYFQFYIPVVYTIWTFLHQIFGLDPMVFHLTGVLFHLANAFLIHDLLKKLKFSPSAALAGTLIFLIHPVQVETVVWVTALRDKVFLFFTLLGVRSYLFSDFRRHKALGVFFMILSILSKPIAVVTAPFVISYLWITGGKKSGSIADFLRQNFLLFIPLLFSFAVISWTNRLQPIADDELVTVYGVDRLIIFFDTVGFYISKLIVPTALYPDYMRIPRKVIEQKLYIKNLLISFVFLAALAAYWLKKIKSASPENKKLFYFGLLWAFLFFLPTSGLLPFGHQHISTTADRYLYAVLISASIVVAAVFERIKTSEKQGFYKGLYAFAVFVLSVSSILESTNWQNHNNFNRHILEKNPTLYFANMGEGNLNLIKKNYFDAFKHFAKAHQTEPNSLAPLAGMANIYFDSKQYDKLDRFAEKHLTHDKLSTMKANQEDIFAIHSMQSDANFERGLYEKAFNNLCALKKLPLPPQQKNEVDDKFRKILTLNASLKCDHF